MELKGRYRIPATREAVWEALSDPAVLRECIPGCQSLEKISPTEARAVVVVEVGGFTATFTGTVRIDAADPPLAISLSAEGRGRPAGSAKGAVAGRLTEADGVTTVTYEGSADVGGKLAEIAAGDVDAKAKALAGRFFAALSRRFEGGKGDWVDELDHSLANVQLGDEPGEDVVVDKTERAGEVAKSLEHRVETAAGTGFLGGAPVWAFIAIIAMIAFLAILYS